MFGKDWRRIEEYIGSRTCAQIRSHAQKYFNRLSRELTKENTQTSDKASDGYPEQQTHSFQSERDSLQQQTNQQLQAIQDKFSSLAQDEIQLQLTSLLVERE